MAFSTLTNTKTILALGPDRSILGTIIRPDPVLIERRGGSNGEVTFNNLLPGAGELLLDQYDDQREIYCNWQFDDEEEPLPRGNGIAEDGTVRSSGKKRKGSKEKSAKKAKESGSVGKGKHEERSLTKERAMKRKRRRQHQDRGQSNGYPHYTAALFG